MNLYYQDIHSKVNAAWHTLKLDRLFLAFQVHLLDIEQTQ